MILDGYRDPELAKKLKLKLDEISSKLDRDVQIMHVCGSHEWTITHYGIRTLLPENVEVRAGPGCPVCVTPAADIDAAVKLALEGKTVVTYGDMSRAKGSSISLMDAKAEGGDVRIVYSIHDAVQLAKKMSEKELIFFAVGFETTAPTTAYELLHNPPKNLSYLVSYRYVPPAVGAVAGSPDMQIDGFINAGHASTVTGMKAYQPYFQATRKPMIFSGFEPIDMLISVVMLLKQIEADSPKMENEYTRSVTWDGNLKAQEAMNSVFDLVPGYWRGVAVIPGSGFQLKQEFIEYDTRVRYGLDDRSADEQFIYGARCGDVIIGKIDPPECPLYMKGCRPDSPKGPTMVSSEGTCRIWAQHRILSSFKCRV